MDENNDSGTTMTKNNTKSAHTISTSYTEIKRMEYGANERAMRHYTYWAKRTNQKTKGNALNELWMHICNYIDAMAKSQTTLSSKKCKFGQIRFEHLSILGKISHLENLIFIYCSNWCVLFSVVINFNAWLLFDPFDSVTGLTMCWIFNWKISLT